MAHATTSDMTNKGQEKYSEWNGFIDELVIVNIFTVAIVFFPKQKIRFGGTQGSP